MRFIENLRDAEKKGSQSIRRGVERVREEWADVERRIRQRMRIYPQKTRSMAAAFPNATPMTLDREIPLESSEKTTDSAPKPIVSVHGQDVNND